MPRIKLFDEEEVLNKATQLFWKKGYHATSMQDLVDYLQINRASLYDTFGSKHKLFERAFEMYRTETHQDIREFLEQHSNVKEGIRNLFIRTINETVNDKEKKGCFMVNVTTELIPEDLAIRKVLVENRKSIIKLFYEYLMKGRKNGMVNKGVDLKSIANLIYILYSGIQVVGKIASGRKELISSVDLVLDLLD